MNKPSEEIEKIRNELYDSIPTGKVDAFELIKTIQSHINKLDDYIQSLPSSNSGQVTDDLRNHDKLEGLLINVCNALYSNLTTDSTYDGTFLDEWITKYYKNLMSQPSVALYRTTLQQLSDWISVEERLPENSEPVLVYSPTSNLIGKNLVGAYYAPHKSGGNSWTVYDFGRANLYGEVTHWMPLPNPPTKK